AVPLMLRKLADHAPGAVRGLEALHAPRAEILAVEDRAHALMSLVGDDDAVRGREALQPGRKVRRRTNNRLLVRFSARKQVTDDDAPGCDADPYTQRIFTEGGQVLDLPHDVHAGADGAFGIVLGRDRIAEIGKNAVAHEPGDMAAIAHDRAAAELAVGADDLQ